MDEEQNWKRLNDAADADLGALLQSGCINQLRSTDPLQQIKKNLRMTTAWTVLIALLYVLVFICYPYWQVILSIGIVFLFTVWGGYSSVIKYRSIQPALPGNKSLLEEMEQHYSSIKSWVDMQIKVAVFVYPAASIGGMFIGFMFGSGKNMEYLLGRPHIWWWFLGTTAIAVPCGLWLGKRLLWKSYGRHLDNLKKNIDDLREEK